MLFSQIMCFDVCNIRKTSVTTWQFKCQTMGSMVFQKQSLWWRAGTPSENMRGLQIYLWCSMLPENTRNHKTALSEGSVTKFAPHNSVVLQNKRSAWSVMDRNTNQTIIEARLNSWQRRWQRVLQHLSATNWLKTFVGDRLMQHHLNLVACKLFLANVHHPEKVYTVPLELMRKSLVPLKTCPLLQTNHINHQSWILHWFNPTKLGRDRFFSKVSGSGSKLPWGRFSFLKKQVQA